MAVRGSNVRLESGVNRTGQSGILAVQSCFMDMQVLLDAVRKMEKSELETKQRLIFGRNQIDDARALSDYDVQQENLLHLVLLASARWHVDLCAGIDRGLGHIGCGDV